MKNNSGKKTKLVLTDKWLIYSIIFIYIFITLVPLMWIFSTSLKSNDVAVSLPPKIFPSDPTIENYVFVITEPRLLHSLINSLLVSLGSTGLSVLISALGGYAFARFKFRGKDILLSIVLGLFMIPIIINIIPLYLMLSQVGLLNSIFTLMITFQILIIPLNIFLLKNYFETIPHELEEAALVDGCSRFGILRRIIIPLSTPGLAIASVLAFRFSWNEFLLPIVLSNRPDSLVFQVALYQFISIYRIEWGYLTAGINIALIPIVVLMLLFQKQLIQGLTAGSLKG
ncbi:MAG TPA: carbohydrate ABC transporter permease [Nitrososphaeraceae archaeon]|nr:carbohydrate ABC transporter permease [Nitrososphaeraceae archaeon]